ncbi:SAG-related sequence [Besnoitia besnoiti]|uniref:SAG-related sequence n=1 Tax=Besnoitia besnoiti TaxID=94643 RepID=A0A2A9MIE0_BESBE|nr:SAG-related sequence [Besnoitia besnoiti]PFH36974.1 SAG-related sequence [Besnoitia besnoiti]
MASANHPSSGVLPARKYRAVFLRWFLLVVLQGSCFCVLGNESSDTSDVETCDTGGAQITLIAEKPGELKFKCGQRFPTLVPTLKPSPMVCDSAECGSLEDLDKASPGAQLVHVDNANNTYKLTTKKWAEYSRFIYLQCRAQTPAVQGLEAKAALAKQTAEGITGGEKCVVRIVLRAQAESDSEPLPSNQCSTPTGQVFFSIGYHGASATFTCGKNMTLSPESQTAVYRTADCTGPTPITDLLPQASLKKQTTGSGSSENPSYTLTVPELPQNPVDQLCFKCVGKNSSADVCKVLIAVEPLSEMDVPPSTNADGTEGDKATSGATAHGVLHALLIWTLGVAAARLS